MNKEKLEVQEIILEIGRVWIDENGICCVEVVKNADVYLEDMKKMIDAQNQLVTLKESTILVDMSQIQTFTREAREYSAKAERDFKVIAQALMVKSAVSRLLGNVYINFNHPKFSTKLFTIRDEAVDWLKEFEV